MKFIQTFLGGWLFFSLVLLALTFPYPEWLVNGAICGGILAVVTYKS